MRFLHQNGETVLPKMHIKGFAILYGLLYNKRSHYRDSVYFFEGAKTLPEIRLEAIASFVRLQTEPGFLLPGEVCPEAKLIYVESGSLRAVIGNRFLSLQEGQLVLCAPGQWHMLYTEEAPVLITSVFSAHGIQALYGQVFTATSDLLQDLLREQEISDGYSHSMALCLLTQLLLTLLRRADQKPAAAQNPIVLRTLQYVAAHLRERLSVPAVARHVGVSPSYLTALFRAHLNLSPGEYLRRAKLHESKRMIRQGDMTFTQIAQALQYTSVYHFSRQFKEQFGLTPTQYAQQENGSGFGQSQF